MGADSSSRVECGLKKESGLISDYARLPFTSEEAKVLAPLTPPEVLNFKPSHDKQVIDFTLDHTVSPNL